MKTQPATFRNHIEGIAPWPQPLPQANDSAAPNLLRRDIKNHKLLKIGLFTTLGLLIVLSLSTTVYYTTTHAKPQNLNSIASVQQIVARHFSLPQHETPALLTVTDNSKLTTPLLRHAENGDKILVYQDAKIVIIYRPSVDRIVDAGPVSLVPLTSNNPASAKANGNE
jgi:hypothetical protein